MKKQNENRIPDVEKEGWEAEELAEEATNKDAEDIVEELRGDEEKKEIPENKTGGCCGG